jgi:hypothetical protein
VGGGWEPRHIQANLGDDHLGGVPADPGDLVQPRDGRPHGRFWVVAGVRAGGAIGVHAQGGGDRCDQLFDPDGERIDLGSQAVDLAEQDVRDLAVVVIEPAGQRLHQRGAFGLHLSPRQIRQLVRVTLPGDHRPPCRGPT